MRKLLMLFVVAGALAACQESDDATTATVQVRGVPENATAVTVSGDIDATFNQTDDVWEASLADVAAGEYSVSVQAQNGDSLSPAIAQTLTVADDAGALTLLADGATCSAAGITPSAVQGTADASTLVGDTVTVIGVVTADFQSGDELEAAFLRDFLGDGDAASSDGLYINLVDQENDVATGELIAVTGTVSEDGDLTQLVDITAVEVCSDGYTVPTTDVSLPTADLGDLEAFEGMLVSFDQTLTVSQNFFQGRYGQVTLSADGRLFNPTNGNNLGEGVDANQRRLVFLDDGQDVNSIGDNPDPVPYLAAGNTLRVGDTVAGLTGVLSYGQVNSSTSVRDYRLHPTADPSLERANPRQDTPDAVGGTLTVASFNVLNYFTTFDERGAFNAGEFERQRDKIIAAIVAMDADVVGLMEIENNGGAGETPRSSSTGQTALDDLLDGLNAEMGAGTYVGFAEPAGTGDDAIKQAIIYKPSTVTPVGDAVVSTDEAYTVNGSSRRPVARVFSDNASGEAFAVVVNHFKSKSCRNAEGDEEDAGQGCYNVTRVAQATALLEMIAALESQTGESDVLVIGDLNAYGAEDPIVTLEQGGFIDLVERDMAAEERYSYVFSPGQSGYLDHALTSSSLADSVTGTTIWHINADEPAFLDYGTPPFKPDSVQALYEPTPFRSSDHDPVIVGLDFSD